MPKNIPGRALCSIDGCERIAHGWGWCSMHYDRARKRGDPLWTRRDTAERTFWSRVDRSSPNGCWPVVAGYVDRRGYAHFGRGAHGAYRFALEKALGRPLAPGMHACHTCDNPSCVRNDDIGWYEINGIRRQRRGHLWEGTTQDNTADRERKGRGAKGERNRGFAHPERQRGVFRYNAKFTDEKVRDIRARVAAGERQIDLAAEYGVWPTAIQKIVSRESWKHVP